MKNAVTKKKRLTHNEKLLVIQSNIISPITTNHFFKIRILDKVTISTSSHIVPLHIHTDKMNVYKIKVSIYNMSAAHEL